MLMPLAVTLGVIHASESTIFPRTVIFYFASNFDGLLAREDIIVVLLSKELVMSASQFE